MSNPIIYVVRHGKTKFNDSTSERFRSWLDLPLDTNGKADAQRAAKMLTGLNIDEIVTSDLIRAAQTAGIIGKHLNVKISLDPGLRPWNLGRISGQKIDDMADVVENFQKKTPDKAVPGGESYSTFFNRWKQCFHKYQKMAEQDPTKIRLLITHSRNVLALEVIVEGKNIKDVPIKGGPSTGALLVIEKNDGKWDMKEIE